MRMAPTLVDWNSAASGAAVSHAGKLRAAGSLLHKQERKKASRCARTWGRSREVRGGLYAAVMELNGGRTAVLR